MKAPPARCTSRHSVLLTSGRVRVCRVVGLLLWSAACGLPTGVEASDWPMWRHDASRSANAPGDLPASMQLSWVVTLPRLEPAWEDAVNRDRMPFDRCYEPIVVGQRLIFGSSRDDLVRAFDTRTGVERWRFRCNGPVRLPPAAAAGNVFVVSDDGCLYVLEAQSGALVRMHRGGPDARKVLGNGRLVSAWPARGGPVTDGTTVFYAAGIWPFMGTFLYALDARTGDVRWENSTLGSRYMNQPHGGAEGFGGLAPQGALALVDGALLVPGGRSVPAALDAADGTLRYYHLSGSRVVEAGSGISRKLEGGSHVCGTKGFFLNHRGLATTLYDAETGDAYLHLRDRVYPVLEDQTLYLSGENIQACRLDDLTKIATQHQVKDRLTGQMKTVTRYHWELKPRWTCAAAAGDALIKAGKRLYAGAGSQITALDVAADSAEVSWQAKVNGTVVRLLCGDNRLFAVTIEGTIHAFAAAGEGATPPEATADKAPPLRGTSAAVDLVSALTAAQDIQRGYCLIHGMGRPDYAEAVLATTELSVIGLSESPTAVSDLRRHFQNLGVYGTRISIHEGSAETFGAPSYLAILSVAEGVPEASSSLQPWLDAVRRSVRPYGGIACFPGFRGRSRRTLSRALRRAESDHWGREKIEGVECLVRRGALPGSDDWTHLYGDCANSAKSNDQLVRAPLGVLWFGMSSHADVLPRHGHGPSEQVTGGRLFIEGINMLSARDVYTGMVLWRRTFEDLGTFGVYYDASYRENPLDTTYNQGHIAGANARGTNYVAAEDAVYLLDGTECLVLDPADGKTRQTIHLPPGPDGAGPPEWGFIGVYEDLLIGGTGFVRASSRYGLTPTNWTEHADQSASAGLAVLDRHSGEVLWQQAARLGFLHNAIVAGNGRLYCIDRLPASAAAQLRRRGDASPVCARVLSVDIRSGDLIWQSEEHAFGTWLGYSTQNDVLIQCGRHSRDMTAAEPRDRMMLMRARDGNILWERKTPHGGPAMLFKDTIVLPAVSSVGRAVDLHTGKEILRENPVTGREMPWSYHRTYGCNSVVASEHLLTFRSGTAAFYDLETNCGTANLGGFKSGCTSNLIAADVVLNAPDYTRTCTCAYQNQTSLALIHMPDVEQWTAADLALGDTSIRTLGLNLAAPGDRQDSDGMVWFDFPVVGGPSPDLPVEVTPPEVQVKGCHSSLISGDMGWVGASSLEGIRALTVTCIPESERPGSAVIPIQTGADDVEEATGGTVDAASSDLELVTEATDQLIGLLFRGIPFSSPDDVAHAYVQFTVDEPTDQPTVLTIEYEPTANPAPFDGAERTLSRRPRGQAKVTWEPKPWSRVGEAARAQRTPDLAPILREVLGNPQWRPGNAVVLLISGHGKRVAQSFEKSPKAAAKLVLVPSRARVLAADRAVPYTVELVFADRWAAPGERVFDISLQGTVVARALDISQEAGQGHTLVRRFAGIPVVDSLRIDLTPTSASSRPPLLSGVSIVRNR